MVSACKGSSALRLRHLLTKKGHSCAHHQICHRYDDQTVCALDDLLQFTLQDP